MEKKMAGLMSLGNLSPARSWCLCSRLSKLRMIFLLCLRCSVRHCDESVHSGFRARRMQWMTWINQHPSSVSEVTPFRMLLSLSIQLYLALALATSQSKRNSFLCCGNGEPRISIVAFCFSSLCCFTSTSPKFVVWRLRVSQPQHLAKM